MLVLETLIYFALTAIPLESGANKSTVDIPFEHKVSPPPAPFQQRFGILLPGQNIAIGVHKVAVFQGTLDFLQLFTEVVHLCGRELNETSMISVANYRESLSAVHTLERVLTADVDRKMETRVSCVCTNSGASTASPFCNFSSESWHCSRRLSKSVRRAGE